MSAFDYPADDEAFDFADVMFACLMNGTTTEQAARAAVAALFRNGRWIPRDRPIRLAWRDWSIVRERILERDNYQCAYCPDEGDEVDHIVPKSKGGSDDETNLTACCGACNRSKGARSLAEWRGRHA